VNFFISTGVQILVAGLVVLGIAIVLCLVILLVGGTWWLLGKLKRDRQIASLSSGSKEG
jgi:flagellar biogenesis protein FliO